MAATCCPSGGHRRRGRRFSCARPALASSEAQRPAPSAAEARPGKRISLWAGCWIRAASCSRALIIPFHPPSTQKRHHFGRPPMAATTEPKDAVVEAVGRLMQGLPPHISVLCRGHFGLAFPMCAHSRWGRQRNGARQFVALCVADHPTGCIANCGQSEATGAILAPGMRHALSTLFCELSSGCHLAAPLGNSGRSPVSKLRRPPPSSLSSDIHGTTM